MENLYKKGFPKRSEQEIYFDILRMSQIQFEQFQKTAHHLNPYNDYFFTENIKTPKTKLLPSSLDSISTLDCQSTLTPLIAMESAAHQNNKTDFHRAGGLYDCVCALFRALWSIIGLDDKFNHWFSFFDYIPSKQKIKPHEKIIASLIDETYSEPDRRAGEVGPWRRDPDFDANHFAVWIDEDSRKVQVTVSGPKLTTNDIWSDCELLLSREVVNATTLEAYLDDVTSLYKGWLLEISGHGLGCTTIAELFYNKIKPEFGAIYFFNPPLSPLHNSSQATFVVGDKRFHLFLNPGDPISNLYASLIPDSRCDVTWASPGDSPLKNHSIGQWLDL